MSTSVRFSGVRRDCARPVGSASICSAFAFTAPRSVTPAASHAAFAAAHVSVTHTGEKSSVASASMRLSDVCACGAYISDTASNERSLPACARLNLRYSPFTSDRLEFVNCS